MNRRRFLGWGVLTGSGLFLTGCTVPFGKMTSLSPPETIRLPEGAADPTWRLLSRVSFGPLPGEAARVQAIGVESYIEEQLFGEESEARALGIRLRGIEAVRGSAMELGDFPERGVLRQLQQAALLQAVYSRHQLQERMVDFWTNHFNIYALKGGGCYLKLTDDREVIRRHALGKFPDLLRASARSPAMLVYLDNRANRKGSPNENYARELMELHTLGVEGGYTQTDVMEVARCLTGWTVESRFARPRGRFRFDPSLHDDGPKTVLGVPLAPGGGEKDGERVLDILLEHPSTAPFLSRKLCRYFLGSAPESWTEKLAHIYRKTGGDLKAILRPLLSSQDLLDSQPILKRPFDFLVSALRVFAADTNGKGVLEHLDKMGQPLYEWPMPDGYPDKTAAWTGSLLARWNFAFALASGAIPGTRIDLAALLSEARDSPAEVADALVEVILGRRADSEPVRPVREKICVHLARASGKIPSEAALCEAAALVIASPQFQWR